FDCWRDSFSKLQPGPIRCRMSRRFGAVKLVAHHVPHDLRVPEIAALFVAEEDVQRPGLLERRSSAAPDPETRNPEANRIAATVMTDAGRRRCLIPPGSRRALRQTGRSHRANDCGSDPAREMVRAWRPGIR